MSDSSPERVKAIALPGRAWPRIANVGSPPGAVRGSPEPQCGERDDFLGESPPRIPRVAAQVRSLLASHEQASGFLETPVASAFLGTVTIGERLGPYRIVEEIGRGGMGVVYRAIRDDEHFTKEVAIKV